MKTRLVQWFLGLMLFSFVSCTKEMSRENKTGPDQTGDFYATIDGFQWNADSLQLVFLNGNGVAINGLSRTGDQISILLPEFKVGSYTLSDQTLSYALYANILDTINNLELYSTSGGGSGTVIISSIDTVNHLVSGTFTLNMVNAADPSSKKTITNGVFAYIPYTGSAGPVINPPGVLDDTLTAKVDGADFTGLTIIVQGAPIGNPTQITIGGINSANTAVISLTIPYTVTAGNHDGEYIGQYYPDFTDVNSVKNAINTGKLTIISNDTVNKRVKGTFSFEAVPANPGTTAVVTEGYFAVNY